jgi:hypothetical protein
MRRQLPVPLVVKQSQTQNHTLESLGSLDLTTHVVHQIDLLDSPAPKLLENLVIILWFFSKILWGGGEEADERLSIGPCE